MLPKTSPEVEGRALTLLELGYSHSMVIKEFKKKNLEVTSGQYP